MFYFESISVTTTFVQDFIMEVNLLQEKGENFLNKKLDFVFSKIDDLLFEKKFKEIEELFVSIDVKSTDPLVLLSILTITDSWKKYLTKRKDFYNKVEIVVREKFNRKKAKELLFDLK